MFLLIVRALALFLSPHMAWRFLLRTADADICVKCNLLRGFGFAAWRPITDDGAEIGERVR